MTETLHQETRGEIIVNNHVVIYYCTYHILCVGFCELVAGTYCSVGYFTNAIFFIEKHGANVMSNCILIEY